jgi:hypothetical protein
MRLLVVAATAGASYGAWQGHVPRAAGRAVLMSANEDAVIMESLRSRAEALDSRPSVRPRSIRPDGMDGAGLRFDEASLASSTGPVFDADDLPEGTILTPAQAIRGLYAAFNARDAACAGSFLTDDCVYEDLLLGPATVCRGKEAFMTALSFHPAFVSSRLFDGLPFANLLPELTLEVDSIAEGKDTVGVEWHVQVGASAFPLGRGLSQARLCATTGKIERVVDIAEAPWRVIGLLVLPFISAVQVLSSTLSGSAEEAGADGADADAQREYELMLSAVLADEMVDPAERALLEDYARKNSVSTAQHEALLARAGWSAEEYRRGTRAGP